MPELEALGFRALGRFDGTMIDLQLLGLAFGLLGAMWSLSRGRARAPVVGVAALAVVTAPQFLLQLGTNYVDIPLAVYVAATLLAGAYWLSGDEPGGLACFVVFGGMTAMLKNEGTMFVTAAIVALLLAASPSGRGRLRRAAMASAAVLAIALPWRVYGAAYDLPTADYDLRNLFDPRYLADHADRVRPVVNELVSEMTDLGRWGLLSYACALALVAGLFAARREVGFFAVAWTALAFAGLVLTYWVSTLPLAGDLSNSSNRTVDSIVIGVTCLVPVLVDDGVSAVLGRARGSPVRI
jgi:4-amino-4-deoxy-L-arabinose transferase-like glycosyltransferase